MTENIQNSLDNILSKVKSIHGELLKERKNNSDLENEIQQLRASNLEKTNQVFSLETEVETLRSALHLAQNKVVEVHHLDKNHENNKIENLVPLCPTHHDYMHFGYGELIQPIIDERKYKASALRN